MTGGKGSESRPFSRRETPYAFTRVGKSKSFSQPPAPLSKFTNIAGYLFAPLTDLKPLRARLLEFCKAHRLKGTILLAPEGINLFVAGDHVAIEELVFKLRRVPGLGDLCPKYSESYEPPFTRMLVRLKKEIIAFGVEGIDPRNDPAPRLSPHELKAWLDEGRPVLLYDTRNDYEIKLGTFKRAVAAGIEHFRDFPEAVERLPEEARKLPVVTFCTGGIRCEKAAPLMRRKGFERVYQLDGGILKYFEEVGGDHYEGECFVFDHRVGLDPALRESGSVVCHACQTPLTQEEAADPRYVEGRTCPYCYCGEDERRAQRVAARQAALDEAVDPLPGGEPYDNRRPIRIPASMDGRTILDTLEALFPHVGREGWRELIDDGRVLGSGGKPVTAGRRVKDGEQYQRLMPGHVEPDVAADIRVLDEDEALIVIDKPAPLPMHPCGRFNRNTLEFLLRRAWALEVPRPLHRLDANTSGLVVCARTRRFAKLMQREFAAGRVEKEYLARVHGLPEEDDWVIDARIADRPAEAGAREIDPEGGREARTRIRVVWRGADGQSLLRVRPETGRTNQIRLDLWDVGHPVVGDPVYLPDGGRGEIQTLAPGDPPMALHAWRVGFRHPISGERATHEAPAPAWAEGIGGPGAGTP